MLRWPGPLTLTQDHAGSIPVEVTTEVKPGRCPGTLAKRIEAQALGIMPSPLRQEGNAARRPSPSRKRLVTPMDGARHLYLPHVSPSVLPRDVGCDKIVAE
ncbi:Sua5/YciO/YrdC/YwlC family protein [Nocardia seriolae]|uniref:Sua5/YciO/YrdC/YwlC family protein n=1 Tax=Nocardia seriolae TaxID=37332 RepID=A0ABC9YXB7_9NOCA|nr:Sua5/YciO/YrdC/YwlC family protein [Nocardia seriolae]GAP30070.1 Sua5/YciO/YrdC/YwlC family protein [Nocardia seriolae]